MASHGNRYSNRQTAANSGGTRPQQLRVRYKDEQGHYERWPEMRVHPDLDTVVRSYLADPRCEFKSIAELIRGCVLEALPRFKMSPQTRSVLQIFRAIEEENARSAMRRQFKQYIEDTAREAYELAGEGRDREAAQHVHRVLNHVRGMDVNDEWRTEFINALMKKFGHLLRRTKVVSLVPATEEEMWEIDGTEASLN